MVVTALSVVAVVGFSARTRDLAFEARSLQRHQARRAAESGVARARMRRAQNRSPEIEGTLPAHLVCDRISYRTEAHNDTLVATGICERGDVRIRARLEVIIRGPGMGTIDAWRER